MYCKNVVSTLLLHNDPDYVLFKVAIDLAEQGLSIWFISIAPFNRIPEKIKQPCKEVLQLITFIYLKDYLDLVRHLNGTHKWKNIPNITIVKDFNIYCNIHDTKYNSMQAAFLSSSLKDSAKYIARRKDSKTLLLVCCSYLSDQNVERLQLLCDMYFSNLLMRSTFNSENDLIYMIEKEFLINKTGDK